MNQTQIKNTLIKYQEEMENLGKKAERIKGSLDSDFKKLKELIQSEQEEENKILKEADALLASLQETINETDERLIALMDEIEAESAKIEEDEENEENEENEDSDES